MNQALAILTHALRMLIHEPLTTLRVVTPAIAVIFATVIAALVLVPEVLIALQNAPATFTVTDGSSIMVLLALTVTGLVGYALMAILWHRHVLLNGTGIDSDLRSGSAVIPGYIWRAFVLGLVQFVIAIPIGIAIAIIGGAGASVTGGIGGFDIIGILAGLLFIWIALRLSVVLPAAALGTTMRIGESWQATAPVSNILWGVTVLLAALNLIIAIVTSAVLPEALTPSVLLQTVIYIIEGLVFVSILTTLYGHLVEGRSLG